MGKVIATVFPLAFLVHLGVSEVVLARRRVALAGRPPVDLRLFLGCKYGVIAVWAGMSLESWGVGFPLAPAGPFLRGLSLGLWIFGFTLLCLGRVGLGSHLRIGLPLEATDLHVNGVYRISRNPMYLGLNATMLAAILYTRNPGILALGALVIAVHHRIILAEEKWLLRAFGGEYAGYRDRVGRYLPLPWASPRPGCSGCPGSGPGRLACRAHALDTLSKMGHCAPTVTRTVLDATGREKDWLVRLAAGLPGGIGNTGGECGGITSILILLGLRSGLSRAEGGLPIAFDQGRGHLQRFRQRNGTLLCREIRRDPPRIWPCVRAIVTSPELYGDALSAAAAVDAGAPGRDCYHVGPASARDAHRLLYAAFTASGFHCAHSVLCSLHAHLPPSRELLDATSLFIAGTVFEGMTCSALTAGIMELGLRLGEIETSRRRVLHMVALLVSGGPAFDDGVNKFNRTMNLGRDLAEWFAGELGSTQCRAITRADFASAADVRAYLRNGGIASCRNVAGKVAARVRLMLGEAGAADRQVEAPLTPAAPPV